MPLTRLIVLRHGETLWNLEGRYQGHLDSPLTELGLKQAHALAKRLQAEAFSTIYTSDLGRALQTAEIISQATGRKLIPHEGLRERHLGVFQGKTGGELKARWPEEYRRLKSGDADYAAPEGESNRAAMARVLATFTQISTQHTGETIAIVTHGGPLSTMFRHTLGVPIDAPRRFSRLNASWNVFIVEDGKWLLETWGDISHLQRQQEIRTA